MNTHRIAGAIALLCLSPSSLLAQRGVGGMGMGGGGGGFGRGRGINMSREAAISIPKYVNAVNLLIEHRQELTLTDSQFVRVIVVKRTLDSTNAPLARRLDSVQRLFKGGGPLFGDPSPERRDSLAAARDVVHEVMSSVHENVSTARDKAYGLLSFSQRTKAQELEDKAERAIVEEEQHRDRGRSGTPGGIGRPPSH
ncbi:MAG TPA: hypothetical protein VK636_07045 [Gemmatimonadaceae bacterium]|nr:hypothetical protein [Gemmatimonadaceae bacterium]